jgi:hypothetical protein
MSASKRVRSFRYIIAIDYPNGCYLRRTLNVTHHGESGEVQYDSKPVRRYKAPDIIQKAIAAVEKALNPKNEEGK